MIQKLKNLAWKLWLRKNWKTLAAVALAIAVYTNHHTDQQERIEALEAAVEALG